MPTDYQRIEEAIRYLEENVRRQPSLGELAAHLNLSPYHFQRLFRRWAGISPKRFLQFLTIVYAKHLLGESRTLLETTHELGLSSSSRLHDLFVTIDGITPGEFKRKGGGTQIVYGFHASPFGECLLAMTKRGICGLFFVDGSREDALVELERKWPAAGLHEQPQSTQTVLKQIFSADPAPEEEDAILPSPEAGGIRRGAGDEGEGAGEGGEERVPSASKYTLSLFLKGTNFQLKVWEALLRIPPGLVCSYQDLAIQIGKPTAARAVANAIGANPIAYLIPCHRVLRKSGLVGGYRWNPVRKKAILAWEAAQRVEQTA